MLEAYLSSHELYESKFPRVLVSGGSISGLTIAYWLTRYGFTVTVVERAPHLRPGGQALDVRGPALTVAERMGILATLREHSTKLTGFSMVDADGKEIHRSEESTLTGGRFESPDVEIMRDDLCRVLPEAVGDRVEYLSTIRWRRSRRTRQGSTSRSSAPLPAASSSSSAAMGCTRGCEGSRLAPRRSSSAVSATRTSLSSACRTSSGSSAGRSCTRTR